MVMEQIIASWHVVAGHLCLNC